MEANVFKRGTALRRHLLRTFATVLLVAGLLSLAVQAGMPKDGVPVLGTARAPAAAQEVAINHPDERMITLCWPLFSRTSLGMMGSLKSKPIDFSTRLWGDNDLEHRR